jgi:hypothetical protein
MRLTSMTWVLAGAALLPAALYAATQTSPPSAPGETTISLTIRDIDSGHLLSHLSVKVQLFRSEGERRLSIPGCVPANDAQPLYSFAGITDPRGALTFRAPGGDYLAKISIPQRQPIFDCITVDTEESMRACGVGPETQRIFVRTGITISGFSGDMLTSHACAPWQPSACEPLRVPNRVETRRIVFLDFQGAPIGNARVDVRQNSKAKGKLVTTLVTGADGGADVSRMLESGGLMRLSVQRGRATSEFLLQFAKGGRDGQQRIRLFHWRCEGSLMEGARVQP